MDWISDQRLTRLRDIAGTPDGEEFRYRILEEIGRGGMATVYRAEDRTLHRQVALKVLSAAQETAGLSERMEREAVILARLEHPGIVPIHDSGKMPDGRLYYAMKMVNGQRLDEFCSTPRPLAERLRVFQRICEPVEFAHACGIIHRDLKPQNIMVGEFGEVLVLDWGVAKILRHAEAAAADAGPSIETAHGTVIGTTGYMAPEQGAGVSGEADPRSDVYSLGRVLNFLIAETRPPKRLMAIAAKASALDRSHRYPDVSNLAADIARFLDGRPVSAYREHWYERIAAWIGRNKTVTALVLAYVVMRALLIFFLGR
jgi:eukaryotic-like serine/threonine-protein kinase